MQSRHLFKVFHFQESDYGKTNTWFQYTQRRMIPQYEQRRTNYATQNAQKSIYRFFKNKKFHHRFSDLLCAVCGMLFSIQLKGNLTREFSVLKNFKVNLETLSPMSQWVLRKSWVGGGVGDQQMSHSVREKSALSAIIDIVSFRSLTWLQWHRP